MEWKESRMGLDFELLVKKDPILFYDEVVLYEDELADHGMSIYSVKTVKIIDLSVLCRLVGLCLLVCS